MINGNEDAEEGHTHQEGGGALNEFDGAIREATLERIRLTILTTSKDARVIVSSELQQSEFLSDLDVPDHSGAYFHAYRALDGYLDAVVVRPTLDVIMEPLAHEVQSSALSPHRVLQSRFVRQLRDAALRSICSTNEIAMNLLREVHAFDELGAFRNSVFHSFEEPRRNDVTHCASLVQRVVDIIESQREAAERAAG